MITRMLAALLAVGLLASPVLAQNVQLDQADGTQTNLGGVGDAAKVTQAGVLAGERLPDSATKSYMAIRDEADVTIVGIQTAITLCGGVANDCHLLGLQITTALTGTCVIAGFADSAGTATSLTFPIGSVGLKDFKGAKNSAGALTITCGTAGDDNFVAVLTRPAS